MWKHKILNGQTAALKQTKPEQTLHDYAKTAERIDGIAQKIEEMNAYSVSNAKSMEEMESATRHLSTLTEELNHVLTDFRT